MTLGITHRSVCSHPTMEYYKLIRAYDHTNYAQWGPIYITEMLTLQIKASNVHSEFVAKQCVVKRNNHYFNEVLAGHATERVNTVCTTAGGIIWIARQYQARYRFCIVRSEISNKNMW